MYRPLLSFFLLWLTSISSGAQDRKYHFSAPKMGSPLNIIIVTADSTQAAQLAARSFALVDSLNHIYSDYDTESELNRLNTSAGRGPQAVSPGLWEILLRSQRAFRASKGAFDITIGTLTRLWRDARKTHSFPASAMIGSALGSSGGKYLQIDTVAHTVTLARPGMRLDLGGIAKGYIAQCVLDFLRRNGIRQALVDAGGDMVMSDAPPGAGGWVVGVNVPETTSELLPRKLLLANQAVATSGDAYQYIEHEGKRYSHIIDPRTGYGISEARNVTVIASDGADADWLATACSVLPIAEAKKLALKMKAELLITTLRDGKVIYHATPGFANYWRTR